MLKMYLHVQTSMLCITSYYQIFGNFEPKITIKLSKNIFSIFQKNVRHIIYHKLRGYEVSTLFTFQPYARKIVNF